MTLPSPFALLKPPPPHAPFLTVCEELKINIDGYDSYIAKDEQGYGSIECMFTHDGGLVDWVNETEYGFPFSTDSVGEVFANFSKQYDGGRVRDASTLASAHHPPTDPSSLPPNTRRATLKPIHPTTARNPQPSPPNTHLFPTYIHSSDGVLMSDKYMFGLKNENVKCNELQFLTVAIESTLKVPSPSTTKKIDEIVKEISLSEPHETLVNKNKQLHRVRRRRVGGRLGERRRRGLLHVFALGVLRRFLGRLLGLSSSLRLRVRLRLRRLGLGLRWVFLSHPFLSLYLLLS